MGKGDRLSTLSGLVTVLLCSLFCPEICKVALEGSAPSVYCTCSPSDSKEIMELPAR